MKKILSILLLFAAVSCQVVSVSPSDQELVVDISCGGNTRISVEPDSESHVWKMGWESTDKLAAWAVNGEVNQFKVATLDSENSDVATFKGQSVSADRLRFVYPYDSEAIVDGAYTIDLSEQRVDMSSDVYMEYGDDNLYMISDEVSINPDGEAIATPVMNHILAALELVITPSAIADAENIYLQKVVLRGADLINKAEVDFESAALSGVAGGDITLNINGAEALQNGVEVSIPFSVVPFALTSDIDVLLYLSNGKVVTVVKNPPLSPVSLAVGTYNKMLVSCDVSASSYDESDFVIGDGGQLTINQLETKNVEITMPSDYDQSAFKSIEATITSNETIESSETVFDWESKVVAPTFDSHGVMLTAPQIAITPAAGTSLSESQRKAVLTVTITDLNDHKVVLHSDLYSEEPSSYTYYEQPEGDISEVITGKEGDLFLLSKEGEAYSNMTYMKSDGGSMFYVEFDDMNRPRTVVDGELLYVFGNYRAKIFDLAVIDSDGNMEVFSDLDYDFDFNPQSVYSAYSPMYAASPVDSCLGAVNVVLGVVSMLESAAVISALAAGTVVASPVIASVGILAVGACAGATAYAMIVDSFDIWVAPAPENMKRASEIIGAVQIFGVKGVADSAGTITKTVLGINYDNIAMMAVGGLKTTIEDHMDSVAAAEKKFEENTNNGGPEQGDIEKMNPFD